MRCVRNVVEEEGGRERNGNRGSKDKWDSDINSREYSSSKYVDNIVENVEKLDRAEWSKGRKEEKEKEREKRWI